MTNGPLELEDLPGVGPTTAEKLREAGFVTVESIATASPAELAETYPFNAEVPEEADRSALGQADEILQELIRNNPEAGFCIRLKQKQQSI